MRRRISKAMTIATRLDRLMQVRKVKSQSALARMAGVPQPTINRILKGQTDTPELGTIKKLAGALDVPATWLAEGPSDEPPLTQGSFRLTNPINKVREVQIEATYDLVLELPDSVLTKLLAALQEAKEKGDYTRLFTTNYDDLLSTATKEVLGGEPDPVPVSNKRVKTR